MSLVLSQTITEFLRKLAGDRDVEEFIAELIAERLDPPRRIELYLKLHGDYLRAAEELYAKGNLAQAGEKYWGGAVTALLNIIGERLGMPPHYSHRDLREIASYLTEVTRDPEYTRLFSSVETLHVISTIASWVGRPLMLIGGCH